MTKHVVVKKRSAFTVDEDDRLRSLVNKYGEENWYYITAKMPKRTTRQCRERWLNYLSSKVVNGPWTIAEDALLFRQVTLYGNRWKAMAPLFPGRTDINIKNRWNLLRSKKAKVDAADVKSGDAILEQTEWVAPSENWAEEDQWSSLACDIDYF